MAYTTTPQVPALTAINPNGTEKWTFPTDSDVTASSIASDGTVYVIISGYKLLYAIQQNGIQKWVFTSPTDLAAPAIGQDGTIYVSSYGGIFYAINSADGTIKWTFDLGLIYAHIPPSSISSDGTIYVSGYNSLHALDSNGNLKWTYPNSDQITSASSIGDDGTIYVGGGSLSAINPDGTQKWRVFLQSYGYVMGTAIASDGTIYMVTDLHDLNGASVYAISPDGTQKWRFTPKQPNDFYDRNPAIGADGTIYVGGYDKFYAINPDGTEKWSFGTRAWKSPSLTADGTLIAANDATLYAFNLTSGGLANSPWPMHGHDPQHTGRQINTTTPVGSISLPQTGQTKCYDTLGKEIACAGTGQDGETRTGSAWPSPRFLNNGDGTITDKLTGLMWLKDANCAHTIGHDPDGSSNGSMGWLNALAFVSGLNNGTYNISSCASYTNHYSNWHLPKSNELASIINYTVPDNSAWLKSVGFTNVMPNYYWSSTSGTYPYSGYRYDGSILVDMRSGGTGGHYPKTYSLYNPYFTWPTRIDERVVGSAPVWKTGQTTCYGAYGDVVACTGTGQDGDIRSGIEWPAPRFKDNADGTVTDNLTGLMWTKSDPVLGGINRSWQDILNLVKDMNAGLRENFGYSDWRLPNIVEITSLLSRQYDRAVIPEGHPFNLVYGYGVITWTSTSLAGHDQSAWLTDTSWGPRIAYDKSGSSGNGWPVRTVDTDGDGIPDWYEDKYGLNKNNSADAKLDKDGDGLTNWQEYKLGTGLLDPTSLSGFLNVIPTIPLDFGSIAVGQSSPNKDFTVQNTGNAMLNGTCTTALPFSFAFGDCTYALAPNEFADIALNFSPAAEGTVNGQVDFSSNGGNASRSVTGTGTLSPPPQGVISVTPKSLDFGTISLSSNSVTKSVTVINTGATNLTLGVLSLTGANSGDFLIPGNTCNNATLGTSPPQNSCLFSIEFKPKVVGPRTADVSIPSNHPARPNTMVAPNGTGMQVPVTLRALYGIPVDFSFQVDLRKDSSYIDVRYLQIVLNIDPVTRLNNKDKDFGSPGFETQMFREQTYLAVARFQDKYHDFIMPGGPLCADIPETQWQDYGCGRVGPNTRNYLNQLISA